MVLQARFNHRPLVSVIIPTYNRCSLVQEAIESVLAQDFKNFELIIVDDGSTDGTEEVLKTRYAETIVYVWQENQGESTARNHGISIAKGEYIAFLDSDDLWMPEKLSHQVSVLQNNSDTGAVFCQVWHVDKSGQRLGKLPLGSKSTPTDFDLATLLMRNKIPAGASTCLMRRSLFEKIGSFSQDIHYGEDWDLWLRVSANSSIDFVAEPLASYRQHTKSQQFFTNSKRIDDILTNRLKMLERCANKFPEKVSRQSYEKAVANQYFVSSLANFLLQEPEKGRERLSKAIDVFPSLWKNKDVFSEQVAVFAESYSIDQEGNFSPTLSLSLVDSLCANLPDALDYKSWKKLTRGKIRVTVGLREYNTKSSWRAIRYMISGLLLSPRLANLSILTILFEPILGHRIINKFRLFYYRDKPYDTHN